MIRNFTVRPSRESESQSMTRAGVVFSMALFDSYCRLGEIIVKRKIHELSLIGGLECVCDNAESEEPSDTPVIAAPQAAAFRDLYENSHSFPQP